jgi:hypothetical protein
MRLLKGTNFLSSRMVGIPVFLNLISKIPNVFLYYSDVMGVYGKFG